MDFKIKTPGRTHPTCTTHNSRRLTPLNSQLALLPSALQWRPQYGMTFLMIDVYPLVTRGINS